MQPVDPIPAANPSPPPRPPDFPADPADPAATPTGEAAAANQLTPEEQMERFAQDLKEHDWGHQPC